jgi:hypothetical protein
LGEFSAPNDNSFLEKFGNFPLLRVKIGPELLFGQGGRGITKLSKLEN